MEHLFSLFTAERRIVDKNAIKLTHMIRYFTLKTVRSKYIVLTTTTKKVLYFVRSHLVPGENITDEKKYDAGNIFCMYCPVCPKSFLVTRQGVFKLPV